MGRMLVQHFLRWIRNNLIDCLDEFRWPPEMVLFETLDSLLPDKFPKVNSGSCWQAIAQCYQRIQKMQAWLEDEDEELLIVGTLENIVNSQDFFCKYSTVFLFFFLSFLYIRIFSSFVNKHFSIFNNSNSVCVCVHGLPRSIGAVQPLLSFLTFGFTVSGFSQSPTITQNVTTTLALGVKRGTSLLDILFGGQPSFHHTILGSTIPDTIRVSLHDGMIGLSLFVETDTLHLSFHSSFGLWVVANVRWKRSRISSRVFSLKIRVPTTALF